MAHGGSRIPLSFDAVSALVTPTPIGLTIREIDPLSGVTIRRHELVLKLWSDRLSTLLHQTIAPSWAAM